MQTIELSIVMPCLNEEETLAVCIDKAKQFLLESKIVGEIIIADNGSTDNSLEIARQKNARIIHVEAKGYGNALKSGIAAALGKYVIMGDSDDSYDFYALAPFVEKLREGYDLVMGNRFKGGIMKGAMPFKNRYLGNPVLSFVGRLFFSIKIGDFHCGLRGFSKEAVQKMDLRTTGMEFASEMVVKASLHKMKITEVPTILHPDGRSRPPHLKPWRDGWRHLRFLLLYSPAWLFLYPGVFFSVISLIFSIILVFSPIKMGNVELDVHSLLYFATFFLVGLQSVYFYFFARIYAFTQKLYPTSEKFSKAFRYLNLESGIVFSLLFIIFGIFLTFVVLKQWNNHAFGELQPRIILRKVIPACVFLLVGFQMFFNSFFFSFLGMKKE